MSSNAALTICVIMRDLHIYSQFISSLLSRLCMQQSGVVAV